MWYDSYGRKLSCRDMEIRTPKEDHTPWRQDTETCCAATTIPILSGQLTACGMARQAKRFLSQPRGIGFIAGLSTVRSPEGNLSLIRTTDVLESDGLSELPNGTDKITCPELCIRMNRNSSLAFMIDEWDNNGTRKYLTMYQDMFYSPDGIRMCFLTSIW